MLTYVYNSHSYLRPQIAITLQMKFEEWQASAPIHWSSFQENPLPSTNESRPYNAPTLSFDGAVPDSTIASTNESEVYNAPMTSFGEQSPFSFGSSPHSTPLNTNQSGPYVAPTP